MSQSKLSEFAIWGFAFGYFASYVPYSALTKAVSSGMLEAMDGPPSSGFVLLPLSVATSLVGMIAFISAMRWWRFAGRRSLFGRSVPSPTAWTLASGVCTAAIIGTTTLAYTFDGISIVFMMLLMRGGVLVIAPIVDMISGRRVRWFSYVALLLSLGALVAAFLESAEFKTRIVAIVDVIIYLAAYFLRLQFMTHIAKSDDPDDQKKYFVEEQMVATPVVFLVLVVLALINQGQIMADVRAGFTEIPGGPVALPIVLIGLFSQGTGIFGGLILLDRRENTFCVPVNRSSSILAGVLATYSIHILLDGRLPRTGELVGAGMIIVAILFLTIPPMRERQQRRAAAAA